MSDSVLSSSDLSAYTYYSTNSEISPSDLSESDLSSYVYYSTNSGIPAKIGYIPGTDISGNTESNVNITDEERVKLENLSEQNVTNSFALDDKVDAIIDAILN